ncbi:CSC1-like protein 2 [Portunus trituberculatus]|uniref:CSC1-like protein 2 n=1 Tax=Portunus trituberculatus TaxID=210409 RepID=A0A5B7CW42_PORTR|nr:CSC1-like protein 2 [Portunus trituberculatus]
MRYWRKWCGAGRCQRGSAGRVCLSTGGGETGEMGTPMEFSFAQTTIAPNETDFELIEPLWQQDKHSCNQYVAQNKTSWLHTGYEGIPENLLINVLAWLLLLSLFTVLRKKAWNYGRLALVQKYESRDEQILAKSGRDAVQYLSFQRHIVIYLMIVCIISISIVLPINFQGTLEGGKKEFGHTTMANLNPQRFSKKLDLKEVTTSASRTLMITRVPRRACHKDTILKHFQEAYPDLEVQDVQFAYDIKSLIEYDKEREVARNARLYCEAYLKETNRRLDMRPYKCGVICGCCDIFGCPTVDAIEFYSEEEMRLSGEVENEKVKALQRPTGVAFLTFDSIENANKVLRDHKNKCDCFRNIPASSVSSELKPYNWFIRVAPSPEDIYCVKGFAEMMFRPQNETFRWECIFLPDNGAFFINYVITSAFIGTSLELIRFPELFMYILRLGLSRSQAETASVRQAILYEFPFGVQYAWMMLIFAMTIIYSVSCPLITPFGTLYMIFKHLVDKYNIYFAYGRSVISKKIHTTAINFVIVSIVCLQLSLLFFSLLRQGLKKDLTIYSIVLLIITCLVFVTHNTLHWFKELSPVEYKEFGSDQPNGEVSSVSEDGLDPDASPTEVACQFVPSVLRDAPSGVESSYSFIGTGQPPRSYGTQPLDDDSIFLGSEAPMRGSGSLYQDYSQPKADPGPGLSLQVRTINAEINTPAPQPCPGEEAAEEEEELYTRGSPTVVTVDGTVTVPFSGDPSGALHSQKHSHLASDQSAPATNV